MSLVIKAAFFTVSYFCDVVLMSMHANIACYYHSSLFLGKCVIAEKYFYSRTNITALEDECS